MDAILPFSCRAEKRNRQKDPAFLDAVPEQYRQAIRDHIASERKKPKKEYVKAEKKDDDEDKKDVKQEVKVTQEVTHEQPELASSASAAPPAGVERTCPAAMSINSFGVLTKTDLGPRAALGAWREEPDETAVASVAAAASARKVEENLETSSTMVVFKSWGYHKVRKGMKKEVFSHDTATGMAREWYRKLKTMW
ncbi:unnamed protein product, partial [Prorocentrum cordatum]